MKPSISKGKWDSSSDEEDDTIKKKLKHSSSSDNTTNALTTIFSIEDKTVSASTDFSSKQFIVQSISTTNITKLVETNENIYKNDIENQTELLIDLPPPIIVSAIIPKVHKYNPIFDGCRSVDCYQRLNFIDQGTYGMVFKAKCRETNEIYALKQIKFGNEISKVGFPITALREINILLALNHPYIVRVREMVIGSSMDKIFMVMEYCENDLKTCMRLSKQSFSIAEIKQLMIQLLSAINHMHERWFIHRDLKTSNLLYSNKGFLAVCDFGLARKYGHPLKPYTIEVVTLWYRAPELLLGERVYSTNIDMWSIGCIFAEMLTGEPLFPGEGENDQISKIFKIMGAPNEEKWPGYALLPNAQQISYRHIPMKSKLRDIFPNASFSGGICLSEQGLDLMNQLLCMNPKQRISAATALNHSWLTTELPKPTLPECMPTFKSRTDENVK